MQIFEDITDLKCRENTVAAVPTNRDTSGTRQRVPMPTKIALKSLPDLRSCAVVFKLAPK